jgi:Na+/H+ antiporter NhaC
MKKITKLKSKKRNCKSREEREMSKAYGLFYSWELLPALTVMGVFLTTVPMGTYAGFKLILGEVRSPLTFGEMRACTGLLFLCFVRDGPIN